MNTRKNPVRVYHLAKRWGWPSSAALNYINAMYKTNYRSPSSRVSRKVLWLLALEPLRYNISYKITRFFKRVATSLLGKE